MRAYDSIKAERGREVNLETPDFLEQARQLLSKSIPIDIKMSGGSMRPAIEDGDVVTVEPFKESLVKAGDIVLYNSFSDTAVVHRVIRVDRGGGERAILTRGDASTQNDIPIPVQRVLGRVKGIERAGERIKMLRPQSPLHRRLIRFLAFFRFFKKD